MEDDDLDSEISTIRAEIRTLQHRRRILSSSILASRPLQRLATKAHPQSPPSAQSQHQQQTQQWAEISPLLQSSSAHARTNHHRIGFSTTTFPFKDPSPTADTPNLLGVRIDIGLRDGTYTKPYYILLRTGTNREGKKEVSVHRHTVPAVVDVGGLERGYLPRSKVPTTTVDGEEVEAEAEAQLKPWKYKPKKQDLKGFVREVRKQLVVWHLRCDAVRYLREKLGVVRRGVDDDAAGFEEDEEGGWERDILGAAAGVGEETRIAKNDLGIVSLGPTALEAVYVRLEWEDGRVGRFKISSTGVVERAVVLGDNGRDKEMEDVITGGDGRVETLFDRLRKHGLSEREEGGDRSEHGDGGEGSEQGYGEDGSDHGDMGDESIL
ncbi:hypothetical protein BO70DRAFT_376437 [Aspergillus heteromorphus CBS 117.55]|uniref:Cenp-O kinetochore centromere component n=1 Tax=Aspergillus heteromorphus CBS 117.55 TaxID=1448321 RepID=A0A317X3D0_9EURO|nr:uncharacterized protein BO70DRAFT_376437 [Aspergillus heteromorphus CBS 117.55]PWY92845.1 hypothetical protein BO70DRAFT_376437 [Aspergillus heteromorphus CBS 117.55]